MKRTVKSNSAGNEMNTDWLSKQHLEALPSSVRFSKILHRQSQDLWKVSTTLLKNSIPNTVTKGNLLFLSHQILTNVESILGYVFGNVTADSVVAGHAVKPWLHHDEDVPSKW
jgi:hypothetical protein